VHVVPGDRVELIRTAAMKTTSIIRLQVGDVGEVVRVNGQACLIRVHGVEVPVPLAHVRPIAAVGPAVRSIHESRPVEPVVTGLDLSFLDAPA